MTSQRAIVIGDVHGCADELRDLLVACAYTPRDSVVFVGDLVAKGPDSRGVLAICRELQAKAVMGNHDFALVSYYRARKRGENWPLRPGHWALAQMFSDAEFEQLDALPLWLELPEHNALIVHGGFVPGVPLEKHDPKLLLNLRTLTPQGTGSTKATGGQLWATNYEGPPFVLFGHHALAGLQKHPWAVGLDTGCVYGKQLTACVLPERSLVSVPARKAYVQVASP